MQSFIRYPAAGLVWNCGSKYSSKRLEEKRLGKVNFNLARPFPVACSFLLLKTLAQNDHKLRRLRLPLLEHRQGERPW